MPPDKMLWPSHQFSRSKANSRTLLVHVSVPSVRLLSLDKQSLNIRATSSLAVRTCSLLILSSGFSSKWWLFVNELCCHTFHRVLGRCAPYGLCPPAMSDCRIVGGHHVQANARDLSDGRICKQPVGIRSTLFLRSPRAIQKFIVQAGILAPAFRSVNAVAWSLVHHRGDANGDETTRSWTRPQVRYSSLAQQLTIAIVSHPLSRLHRSRCHMKSFPFPDGLLHEETSSWNFCDQCRVDCFVSGADAMKKASSGPNVDHTAKAPSDCFRVSLLSIVSTRGVVRYNQSMQNKFISHNISPKTSCL